MRVTLIAAVLVGLALAPTAAGKDITMARACGPDECVALADRQVMEILNSGGSVSKPPPSAPYVRLDFTFDEGGPDENSFSHIFVPSTGLIGANGETQQALLWFENDGVITERFRRTISRLQPFAAPSTWPRNLDKPGGWTNYAPLADEGTNWRAWAFTLGAAMVALSLGGLLARQLRLRRLTTA
jgi:hypothetical protein